MRPSRGLNGSGNVNHCGNRLVQQEWGRENKVN